jgi:formimidoylglutamase
VAAWSSLLDLVRLADSPRRPDDPRLGELIEFWRGNDDAIRPGRPVVIGFPCDIGVQRNLGRPGAAHAPAAVRLALYRLTAWDGLDDVNLTDNPPLDLGDVRVGTDLVAAQDSLAQVVAGVVRRGAVPIVVGGGHETALGVYLGQASSGRSVRVVNLDAHLDVRPTVDGQGTSGTAFRQMLEHPAHPLPGRHYACLGAMTGSVARAHWLWVREKGGVVRWADEVRGRLADEWDREVARLSADLPIQLSLDADVVRQADVPGVSAPNAGGLSGHEVLVVLRKAGAAANVASLEVVEVNPSLDRDGQSVRWAAQAIWSFLAGLARRPT